MPSLRFTTFLAPTLLPVYEAVVEAVGAALGVPTELTVGGDYEECSQRNHDACFVCSLPYVTLERDGTGHASPVAAPVLRGERYGGRPIYFSDVIVRADSSLRAWRDLEGRVLACNEACSHSGYQVVRARLAAGGHGGDYFSRALEAGSHRRAIELVESGRADAAAIDSTVLEDEQRQRPELATRLRVIDSLGPSPAPPLVVSRRLPPEPRRALLEALLHMHEDDTGRALLHRAGGSHFVAREDADYHAIRAIQDEAERVALPLRPLPTLDG